ncbi:MAG TPA: mercuric reductase [Vicinamibacterales bacterium]|nr:mercuric reductase [Vicinamibacterales bacterium]
MIDEHDRRLDSLVRPPGFHNPSPAAMYDMVVIGAGTAGLVCAAGAAGLGARVALVERIRLGGDCLNTGCVPSKALLRSARVVGESRKGTALGVPATAQPDFQAVMTRLRARRADLASADSVDRFTALGVDVFFGSAAFSGPRSVTVRAGTGSGDVELPFRKAVIATGSKPVVPDIPGLAATPFHTNESVFEITEQPRELAVIGAGPSGCELAQAFARLGTRVTLIESGHQLLPREDREAAAIVEARLRSDGVEVLLSSRLHAVRWQDGRFTLEQAGRAITADAVLAASGRAPRVDKLQLDKAGVAHGPEGVVVDDRLRTSNPRVYAAGDVCSKYKFTHAADAMARIVVRNALFFGRARASSLIIPWCTFTSPEVGRVGETGHEAAANGAEAITIPLTSVDRAVVDETTDGFVRVHHRNGRIVGATVVAAGAGELVSVIALAMRHGGSLSDLSSTIFPYPTLSVALRQAGDVYRRSALTPRKLKALHYYFQVFR